MRPRCRVLVVDDQEEAAVAVPAMPGRSGYDRDVETRAAAVTAAALAVRPRSAWRDCRPLKPAVSDSLDALLRGARCRAGAARLGARTAHARKAAAEVDTASPLPY